MAPIHNAAARGNMNRVRALLNSGTNVNARDSWDRRTALHWAVERGHLAVVMLLLDRGANVNARTNFGWTALQWAANFGHLAVVRLLLERGANINARTDNGWTAFMIAAARGQLAMVRLLLERGANTNGVLNRQRISANIRNAIIKHNAAKTILKYKKALNMRRRLSFIGSNFAKSLPRNMTRKILNK